MLRDILTLFRVNIPFIQTFLPELTGCLPCIFKMFMALSILLFIESVGLVTKLCRLL